MHEIEDPGVALKSMIDQLTGRSRQEAPARSSPASRKTRGDWMIAAGGLTLGLVCALFPWYIFFNQEKFGVRALKFSGNGDVTASAGMSGQPQRIGAPMSIEDVPISQLDLFSTGTVSPDDPFAPASPESQPFPSDLVEYRLIHVANGRAMIEDKDGIWIVQVGSVLPDSSRVTAIEKREGKWAIVTSNEKVVELTE